MSRKDEGLSRSTQEKIGKYLFDLPDEESKGWDMRTRIKSKEMMNALTYLGVLAEILKSENARKGKDLLERLLVSSDKGMGRIEATTALTHGMLTTSKYIPLGIEPVELGSKTRKD